MKAEILNILAVMMNCSNEELVAKAEIELEELKRKIDKWDEKETPKQVIVEEVYDFFQEANEQYTCSQCNCCLFPEENYCYNCGQKLDWESEGE